MEGNDQVPAWADALGKRFDEGMAAVNQRLDAIESGAGAGAASEEELARKKAEEEAAAAKALQEEADRKAAEEAARLDSEEAARKAEEKAKVRADAEETLRKENETLRADAQRVSKDNANLQEQIKAMDAKITVLTTPLSNDDRDALSGAQARWDSVAQMFGEQVAAPLFGENPIAYRKRLAAKFQKHSERLKDIRLDSLDEQAFAVIEEQIRQDAQVYARSPEVSPSGKLIPIIRRDSAGREITEFHGDMDAWLGFFKQKGHALRLRSPRQ